MKKILFLCMLINNILLADSIEISLSGLKFNYKEYISKENVIDSESSSYYNLNGINIRIMKEIGRFILNPNIEYNKGITHYKGSNVEGSSLSYTEHHVYLYNLNLITKYNLFENKTLIGNYNFYILGGLGYRFWNRGKSNYIGDYNEKYKWIYYLLGGEIEEQFNSINIELQVYFQKAIKPKMKSDLGNGYIYNLGKTSGYRIIMPIKYVLTTNYGIVFRYIYDNLKINKSDIKNITLNKQLIHSYEPDSKTKNQYLNIGFYYNF